MKNNGNKLNLIDRRGDRGTTSLFSGERVSKSSLRPEALGDLDELQSILGIARYFAKKARTKKEILELQQELFLLGSEIATTEKEKSSLLSKRLDKTRLEQFEKKVQSLHDATPIPENFVIPGDHLATAYLHHARAVARRCERKIVRLFEIHEIQNEHLLAWINRLSIYLFLMAQFENIKQRIKTK